MLQLHDLIRGENIVTDICNKFPETAPVFQKFNMRAGCYDCPITFAARKSGVQLDQLLVEVNQEVYRRRGITS